MTRPVAVAEVPSEDMARVAANALAFLPARSKIKHARLQVSARSLRITATDGYTVGQDHCDLETSNVNEAAYFEVEVTREGLAELDSIGRANKKGLHRIEIYPDDAVKVVCGDEETAVEATVTNPEVWGMVDDLLTLLEDRDPTLPQVIAFDPTLLMRFSKVKADKSERIMDCYMTDVYAPVLVKIGPTFIGAIMPIEREIHAQNQGEDGLWR